MAVQMDIYNLMTKNHKLSSYKLDSMAGLLRYLPTRLLSHVRYSHSTSPYALSGTGSGMVLRAVSTDASVVLRTYQTSTRRYHPILSGLYCDSRARTDMRKGSIAMLVLACRYLIAVQVYGLRGIPKASIAYLVSP
eukprot:2609206-Rhodomonas_salina.2